MKEFRGAVSFSGYMEFTVKAEDRFEAMKKLYETLHLKVEVDPGYQVTAAINEWDLIGKADDAPYLWDVEIEEVR